MTVGLGVKTSVVALLAGVSLGACGTDLGSREAAVGAVERYQQAFLDSDAEAVCSMLTGDAKRVLIVKAAEFDEGTDCPNIMEAVLDLLGEDELAQIRSEQAQLDPGNVRLTNAGAIVEDEDFSVALKRIDEVWYADVSSAATFPDPFPTDTVIDSAKLEDTVQQSLEGSQGQGVKAVECPSDQEVVVGATFTCTVEYSDGGEATATLKIRNEDADLSLIDLGAK